MKESSSSEEEFESSSSEDTVKRSKAPSKLEMAKQSVEESEEESDTDSDEGHPEHTSNLRKDVTTVAATAAKDGTGLPDSAGGRRERDANGGKGDATDEPLSKKRKETKDDRTRLQAGKPVAASKGEKAAKTDPVSKATKAKSSKADNGKPSAASRKRKQSPPPLTNSRLQKVDLEKFSPAKPKKVYHWTPQSEQELASFLLRDSKNGTIPLPTTKLDPYWEKLLRELSLERELTEVQLYEKVRRTKTRYFLLKERIAKDSSSKLKKPEDMKMFKSWGAIWDPGQEKVVRPVKSLPPAEEEDSEDDSAGTAPRPSGIKDAGEVGTKRDDSSSEDESEEEDEETEIMKGKTAGLNDVSVDSKTLHDKVGLVSPFVSKPLLSHTPLPPKGDKVSKKLEEASVGDERTAQVLAADLNSLKNDVMKQLNSLKTDSVNLIRQEVNLGLQQAHGFQSVQDRYESLRGGSGLLSLGSALGKSGMLEALGTRPPSQAMQNKMHRFRVQELELFIFGLQILREDCELQLQELELQKEMRDLEKN